MSADSERVESAIQMLSEHFDTVQIFVTRHDGNVGTASTIMGIGNWFARVGQARDWLVEQEALTKNNILQKND